MGSIRYSEVTPLHTAGKLLMNASNETVYLRGVAIGDLSWRLTFQGNLETRIQRLLDLTEGRVTAIRCAISPQPNTYGLALNTPDVFDPAVDELVRICVKYDLYVYTNFHGTSDPELISEFKTDPTRFIDWHLHFIERYKEVPNFVGVELYNEPPPSFSPTEFRTLVTAAYDAIRTANPNALVIVASVPYSRVDPDWIARPLGDQAVYSWDSYLHHYDDEWYLKPYEEHDAELGKARIVEHMIDWRNINASIPIMCTEFGWKDDDNVTAVSDWYEIMNNCDNHWTTWMWWGTPKNYGLAIDFSYSEFTRQGDVMNQFLK